MVNGACMPTQQKCTEDEDERQNAKKRFSFWNSFKSEMETESVYIHVPMKLLPGYTATTNSSWKLFCDVTSL